MSKFMVDRGTKITEHEASELLLNSLQKYQVITSRFLINFGGSIPKVLASKMIVDAIKEKEYVITHMLVEMGAIVPKHLVSKLPPKCINEMDYYNQPHVTFKYTTENVSLFQSCAVGNVLLFCPINYYQITYCSLFGRQKYSTRGQFLCITLNFYSYAQIFI